MKKSWWQTSLQVFWWSVFVVLGLAGAVGFLPRLPLGLPFQVFVIQSGSMEPSIMTGDVVITQPADRYQPREVITYYDGNQRVVTHRILEAQSDTGQLSYRTQGDANATADITPIPQPQVIGRVSLVIPKLGYLMAFSKTPAGIVTLIIIPATLVVADELTGVLKSLRKNS